MKKSTFFVLFFILFNINQNMIYANNFVFNESIVNIEKESYPISENYNTIINSNYIGEDGEYIFFSKSNNIYSFSKSNSSISILYEINENIIIYKTYYNNDNIYLLYLENIDELENNRFTLKNVSTNEELYVDETTKLPYLYFTDNHIYINYDFYENTLNCYKFYRSSLISLYKEKDFNRIYEVNYGIDKNNFIYGKSIIYCGGIDNKVYFQLIEAENGSFEESTKNQIISFDYLVEEIKIHNMRKSDIKLLDISYFNLDDLTLHIGGNKNYYITSLYNFSKPLNDSGLLTDTNTKDNLIIPKIESGNDIVYSSFSDNKLLMVSYHNIYLYDLTNKLYYYEEYNNSVGNAIIVNEDISFFSFENDKININRYSVGENK